jgi:hypothetical protein
MGGVKMNRMKEGETERKRLQQKKNEGKRKTR